METNQKSGGMGFRHWVFVAAAILAGVALYLVLISSI